MKKNRKNYYKILENLIKMIKNNIKNSRKINKNLEKLIKIKKILEIF